jgi:hypothetical protein
LQLFSDYERTDTNRANYAESPFSFLDRSARNRDQRVRNVLEDWFGRYPAGGRHELKRRFEARAAGSYESAFFELSIHAILDRLGCSLEPHPQLEGVSTRPEFRVTDPNGSVFILEARLAGNPSQADAGREKLEATILDAIDSRIASEHFRVSIQIYGTPTSQPSPKDLVAFLQDKLSATDPNDLLGLPTPGEPRWAFKVGEGCTIFFRPILKSIFPRSRPIAVIRKQLLPPTNPDCIFDAVMDKANKYGPMTVPYVVAINVMPFDLEDAEAVANEVGRLWVNPRTKNVSAVLIAHWMMPHSIRQTVIRLYHHPEARYRYSGVLTQFPQVFVDAEAQCRFKEGRSVGEILGIPPDWPRFGSNE